MNSGCRFFSDPESMNRKVCFCAALMQPQCNMHLAPLNAGRILVKKKKKKKKTDL